MTEQIIVELQRLLQGRKEIKLAFLFGSQAKKRALSESDYDIAVWPEEGTSEEKINQLWLDLEKVVKRSVDLINLPQARPTIAWEALRGLPLVIRDNKFYIDNMLLISSEAEDFQDFVIDVWKAREGKNEL
ncbi:nucleotidyltransferase domain-containing protein [Candidatus Saganbacteria bacterium]|nr:nucleotidyltransferase domain-containing protein [Candidatus Saganbacteria bacterium]